MKLKTTLLSAMAFGLALTLAIPVLRAEEAGATPAPAPAAKEKASKPKAEKATGAIEKVDAAAKSIAIGGKTYKVDDKVRVIIDGAPKTLADLQVGDTVTLKYMTDADGSLVAQAIRKGEGKRGGGKKK
ncbi:MAG: DUF5666 domain-containing protein [Spirochaetota bacterium]